MRRPFDPGEDYYGPGPDGFDENTFYAILIVTFGVPLLLCLIYGKRSIGSYLTASLVGVAGLGIMGSIIMIYVIFSDLIWIPLTLYSLFLCYVMHITNSNKNRDDHLVSSDSIKKNKIARDAILTINNEKHEIISDNQLKSESENKFADFTVSHIKAGLFHMGSHLDVLGHRSNENLVSIEISMDYWISTTPCTQSQWLGIMSHNPSKFVGSLNPVEGVTYEEALQFCNLLTIAQHNSGILPSTLKWTLPTEAQWEYACRAGTQTSLNNGTNITRVDGQCPNLDELAWYKFNSEQKTHAVGQKKPNAWGLYDMHGNVWEWCLDWYSEKNLGGKDPIQLNPGKFRSIRGGGWGDQPWGCRSSVRHQNPLPRDSDFGFRPVIVYENYLSPS